VITDLGVFDITGIGFAVVDLAPGVAYDEVVAKTSAAVTDAREHRAAVGTRGDETSSVA
jgi:3-oxoacid CoA-transferase subunit B